MQKNTINKITEIVRKKQKETYINSKIQKKKTNSMLYNKPTKEISSYISYNKFLSQQFHK
jgi:hypothetical protein